MAGKLVPIFLLILFCLIGCRQQNQPPSLTQNQDTETSASFERKECQSLDTTLLNKNLQVTTPWRIAYLFKTSSDPFWQRMAQAVAQTNQAFKVQGIVKFTEEKPNAQGDVEKQINLILELIESQTLDGLIIAPEDSIQLVPVVERATAQGIPVIIIDTPIDTNNILTFVSFDNFQGGKIIGKWVAKEIEEKANSDRNIGILILEGSLHEENTIERRQGFLAGLKTISQDYQLDILDLKSANWTTSKAKEITTAWLEKFSDIDVIMAADDQMAIGASQAVREAKRSGIIITGFDGVPLGLNAIKAGKIQATIDQIPEIQINLITQLMIRYLENRDQTFPPCQLIGGTHTETSLIITFENIDNYLK